ncbi:DUF1707 domain-containing protein [Streptomyces antnestii]|uniref:DUF1707 domain-containing protein n=1 Tax=Streptomyces antnestii TaxID=2494256 RepID=A0A437PCA1_9ACTN|nr:DUF1707 domain-containing protein [Streptomyces sp. San01]RVU19871.1 DUF1707 domain-containing protein [Streptomyces sp. San01]
MPGEKVPDRRELRASHEDRDQVVERLTVAAGDGRLTADELDDRLGAALTARTYGDLAALLADLPEAGLAWGAPKDVSRIVVGGASERRAGDRVAPGRLEIASRSGSVLLDFTQTAVAVPTLEIEVAVRSGSVTLLMQPHADDVRVRGGGVGDQVGPGAETPARLRIEVTGEVDCGRVTVRPSAESRRGFWQWLLRRPRPAAPLPR